MSHSTSSNGRAALIALSILHGGDWDAIYADVRNHNVPEIPEDLPENAITILDEEYPESLRHSPKPPFVLWREGDPTLLSSARVLSLAGSREPSEYGRCVAELIGGRCADKGIVLCAKLSKGCQASALRECSRGGKAIAVLYRGIDDREPDGQLSRIRDGIVENGGLIVSEYPGKTEPSARSALESTRIVAALGKAMAIPEAKDRSGSVAAAAMALAIGKDVACAPHRITDDDACDGLISEGAYCIRDIGTFLEDFFPEKGA